MRHGVSVRCRLPRALYSAGRLSDVCRLPDQAYATAFFAIPGIRWFLNKRRNSAIEARNQARLDALRRCAQPCTAPEAGGSCQARRERRHQRPRYRLQLRQVCMHHGQTFALQAHALVPTDEVNLCIGGASAG